MGGKNYFQPDGWLAARNQTKGILLGNRVAIADTSLSRFIGLLGRRGLNSGEGLLIRPSNGVHTLGMRFVIDVLMLDKSGLVLAVHERLRPFRITRINWRVSSALELPAGTIANSNTTIGDQLLFEPSVD